MTTRVLVDGAAGFLGRHVVSALEARGVAVRATDRPGTTLTGGARVEKVHADLAERGALDALFEGVTHAVHVAGLFDLSASREALRAANVELARSVADAAMRARVRRYVHVSSVTVVGLPAGGFARDDAAYAPRNDYERTKAEGERAVIELARAGALRATVVRPSGIYGPHGRYGLGVMAAAAALAASRERPEAAVRGEARMTHVHVDDVASAIARVCDDDALADERVVGRAFFVADEVPAAWSNVARVVDGFLGVRRRGVTRITPLAARALIAMAQLQPARVAATNRRLAERWGALVRARSLVSALSPKLDPAAWAYWTGDHVYDTAPLRALGWRAAWPDAHVGLRATLEWYVREGWLPDPAAPRAR